MRLLRSDSAKKYWAIPVGAILFLLATVFLCRQAYLDKIDMNNEDTIIVSNVEDSEGNTATQIKWLDFTVSYDALCRAYEWDVKTHGTDCKLD